MTYMYIKLAVCEDNANISSIVRINVVSVSMYCFYFN